MGVKIRGGIASEVMSTLKNEHVYIGSLLLGLEDQHGKLGSENVDYHLLRDMLHYLSYYPDMCHHAREECLFDKLQLRQSSLRRDIGILRSQHTSIATENRRLLNVIGSIVSTKIRPDDKKLGAALKIYLRRYREHIRIEERTIFPAATKHLKDDDWNQIKVSFQHMDDPIFGHKIKREYAILARYLNTEYDRFLDHAALAEILGIEALIESAAALSDVTTSLTLVAKKHCSVAWKENIELLQSSLSYGVDPRLRNLPGTWMGQGLKRSSSSVNELNSILKTAKQSILEPLTTRKKYYRNLVGY